MNALRASIAPYWESIQRTLFPRLEQALGPLTEKQQQLVQTLEVIRIERLIPRYFRAPGRPPKDRAAMARAFVAKAVYGLPSTRALLDRLAADVALRRLCGWERKFEVPSESVFSRAFAEFADTQLPQRMHEALIRETHHDRLVGHLSRDSTAIEAREKPATKEKPSPPPKRKRGRPKKGEERPKVLTRLERQPTMNLPAMLDDLPTACDVGTKKNSKGYKTTWVGYKLHIDVADGQNMGLYHDRYVVTSGERASSPYPFGFGYINQRAFEPGAPESSRWRTIMAYQNQCRDSDFNCQGPLLFSNSDIVRDGDRLGVPGDNWSSSVVGPADARRTLNESRFIIANYRTLRRRETCLGAAGPPTITLQASNGQYFVAEGGGGGAVSANRSAAGAWEQFQVTDPSGGCVTSGDAVFFRTYGSFYLRAELGGGSTLDAAGAAAGAWEQFVIRNQGGGDVFDGDLVTLQAPSGHYVVAEGGGGGAVLANRPAAGLWESFRIGNAN